MAGNKMQSLMVKKKRTPRVVRPAPAKLPLRAHPSLLHGFLVKLPPSLSVPARTGRLAGVKTEAVNVAAQREIGSKCEGPSRDVTFH